MAGNLVFFYRDMDSAVLMYVSLWLLSTKASHAWCVHVTFFQIDEGVDYIRSN